MAEIEIFIGLKIPDTTAITTFKTFQKLGYNIKKLSRRTYYHIEFEGNIEEFKQKITKVDIIVNANKNTFSFDYAELTGEKIIVTDIDEDDELLQILKNRLNLSEIKNIRQGILWILDCDKKTAEKAAKELLFNNNYQKMEFR